MKKLDLARFQKGRESMIVAGRYSFTVRRPTQLEVVRLMADGGNVSIETACRHVVGWGGVQESDLLPGGDPEPVEFDGDLFAAWIADQPDLWGVIVKGVVDAVRQHEEAVETRGNV